MKYGSNPYNKLQQEFRVHLRQSPHEMAKFGVSRDNFALNSRSF
jgi:hypothetical protein